ncbi:MAG: hypothetical protein LBT54_05215, partial [Bifidobacteriaceae bacterium]|nr:hypothetical protein [Bifidobacteriaceae bacterium]
ATPPEAPDGWADLVVQRNLGADSLQRWLADQGHPTDRLASAKGYRVLRAHPQSPPPPAVRLG